MAKESFLQSYVLISRGLSAKSINTFSAKLNKSNRV